MEDFKNPTTFDIISKCLAEFAGTFLLLFLGCSTDLPWKTETVPYLGAFNFGLIIMLCIQCFGAVSGGIFNPAVTLSAVICDVISAPVRNIFA